MRCSFKQMLPRLLTMEEGKDLVSAARTTAQSRPFPVRSLQFSFILLLLALGFSTIGMYLYQSFSGQQAIALAASVIHTCQGDGGSLEDWIQPPKKLLHTMNDSELLWRASFSPRIQEYPYKRVPKIAFMFLTKGELPLAPLWERFFKGHQGLYSIYLHSISTGDDYPASSVFHNRQIPSQPVAWGEISMCEAERRLLANALLDISNERFVLVSEACIPLHNFTFIYQYISGSQHSFMGSFDDPGSTGRGRYDQRMEPEVKLEQWRKGSQWFEVDRRLAMSIVEDTTYYSKFRDFCKPACYSDEHYFPTMLTIRFPHLLANRTLTWTDWSRSGPHPASFGQDEIDEAFFKKMLEGQECLYNLQPSKDCYLFARKFAPNALDRLLQVASKVFGY